MIKFVNLALITTFLFSSFPDEYYKITNTKKMKEYFFDYLSPLIKKENNKILNEREFIIKNFKNYLKGDSKVLDKFKFLQKKYKIKNISNIDEYLKKVDIIPVSMVLAQAALESGWGKSRFSKEANNIFGQWTWSKEGIIPKNRDVNKKHKIRKFNSLKEAIKAHLHNLNVGWAYEKLREYRYMLRQRDTAPNGILMLRGLDKYSQNKKYNETIQKLIIDNKLYKYDL